MPAPQWSRPTASGAYEFGFADGSTRLLPPTPSVVAADANLPDGPDTSALGASIEGSDPMAGATAGVSLEDAAKAALAGNASAPPSSSGFGDGLTVASDAPLGQRAGDLSSAPAPVTQPEVVAGAIDTMRAGAPTSAGGRFTSAADRALAAEVAASRYGMTTNSRAEGEAPAAGNYLANPNEGGAPEVPRPQPLRVHTIPGGPRTAQWTYQSREVPQEARDMAMDALETGDIARQMGAQEESAAHQDRIAQARATDQAQRYQDEQDAKAEKARMAAQADRLATIDDDISKLETEINPDRYWDSKSTLSKILLGMALFASGSAAKGGRPDVVGAAIDKAIERDIDAQKEGIKNRKGKAQLRDSLYAKFVDYYGDERKAELAVRAAYDRRVARNFEIQAAQTKDPARASLLTQGRADYLARSAQTMMELDGRNVSETVVNVPDKTFTTGGAPKTKPGAEGMEVPGYGRALTPKDAERARRSIAAANNIQDGIKRLKALTATAWDRMTPAKRAEAQSERANLILELKEAKEMGAVDAGMVAIADSLIGDPTSVVDLGGRTAGLDALGNQTRRSVDNQLKSMGLTPTTRTMTPEGPRSDYTGEQPMQPRKPTPVTGFQRAGQ